MSDPRPCKGDAYHPAEISGHRVTPDFTCDDCGERCDRWGKCLGQEGYTFAKAAGLALKGANQ